MSSYLSSNAKPDYPRGVRRYANTKFSGGSWYGVMRESHKLQKYSTPMIYPAARDKPSRRLSEMPACPYLFFRLIFRWYFTPFRFKVKGPAGKILSLDSVYRP